MIQNIDFVTVPGPHMNLFLMNEDKTTVAYIYDLKKLTVKKFVSPFYLNQYVKLFLIFSLLEGGEVFHLHQTGPPESTPIGIGVCAIPYNHSEFVTIGGVMSDDSVHGLVYR